MKNTLILTLMALAFYVNAVEAQNVNYGFKGGLNISTFHGNRSYDGIDRNSLLGFHLGLVAENRINRGFAIQPELLYTRLGAEEDNYAKYYLDYISVPVMAKFYVADQLSLDFGPQLGFLVKDTVKFADDYYEYDAGANTFDFAFNAGLSLDLERHWFAQVRYSVGLAAVLENPDVQNGVFQLSIGHRF